MLAQHAADDGARWAILVDKLTILIVNHKEEAAKWLQDLLVQLERKSASIRDCDGKLWAILRMRQHWLVRLDDKLVEINQYLDRLLTYFEPSDMAVRTVQLFETDPGWMNHDEQARPQCIARLRAALEPIGERPDPIRIVQEMAGRITSVANIMGELLAETPFAGDIEDGMLGALGTPPINTIALPFLRKRVEMHGSDCLSQFLEWLVKRDSLEPAIILSLALPSTPKIWDLLEEVDDRLATQYWRRSRGGNIHDDLSVDERQRAIDRMLDGHNIVGAIQVSEKTAAQLDIATVVRVLRHWYNTEEIVSEACRSGLDYLLNRFDGAEHIDTELAWRLENHAFRRLDRTPVRLFNFMATDPIQFAAIVCQAYDRYDENGDMADDDSSRSEANTAQNILQKWHRIPGQELCESERDKYLVDWARRVLERTHQDECSCGGNLEVARVLARAPAASDGAWPSLAVRQLLEQDKEQQLTRMVRSVRSCGSELWSPRIGGANKRRLAAVYRRDANAIALQWPRTSTMLMELANIHEEYAEGEDAVSRHMGHEPQTT